ncbi:hypothetical protein IHO13_05270 [Wolbachia endosymbiont of Mansonella perstans]|nr:hypothetical protein [Wolbachia endosymbiont of Mansonella perstans]MCA4774578.1 hypothetical protein [Wolbachia endosymbiont of Mansonella perstans]
MEEIKKIELSLPDRNLPMEVQQQQYESKERIVKDKVKRLEMYASNLEMINQKWLDLIQQTTATAKKREEEKYERMVNDKQGILHMINNSKETIITLHSYCNDLEMVFQKGKLLATTEKELVKPSPLIIRQ